jgi:two-component system, response regulator PdtaR
VSLLPYQYPQYNPFLPAEMYLLPVLRMSERPSPSQTSAHASPKASEEAADSLQGKRAVVVEDEGVTQLQLRKILRSEGMEVVGAAANGQDAIQVVLETKPDLVLMDIRMPVMDGLEASRRILADYHVCIVMVTAFSEEEFRQEAQDIGACGYILKPVTTETLIPQLREALRKFTQQ